MLPKNILVPTDFSEGAEEALTYACELASRLGATVHLVNVVGIPSLGVPELGVAVTATMIDQVGADNQKTIDKLAQDFSSKAMIGHAILKTGDARDAINQAAAELNCDLIVMGTHGRRGVTRVLLGSVAETVVRTAPCPVLTIRPHKSEHHDRSAA